MTYSGEDYDVIVIGKGPTGKEAAKKVARMGKTALLLKLNPGAIASVMCSSSQPGSPQGIPDGIEAQIIRLEEEGDWSPKLRFENLDSNSHHSVYILQAPEEPTPELTPLSEENFPNEAEFSPQDHDDSGIQDSPFTQFTLEPESPPDWNQEIHEEGEKNLFDHEPTFNDGPLHLERDRSPSYVDPKPETDTILHERELHNRRRLLHRPAPPVDFNRKTFSSPTNREEPPEPEKPKESIFRERERELRKKLIRDRRPTLDNEFPVPPSRPFQQEPEKENPPAPEQRKDFPEPAEVSPDLFAGAEESNRPSKASSSVISMEQGRVKYRKANRYKEPIRLFSRENTKREMPPPEPGQDPEVPKGRVWEAHEQTSHPSLTNSEGSQKEPTRRLTYEPFQGAKEKQPISGNSFEPFGAKPPKAREEEPAADSPLTSGPLQGQTRKPPSTPEPKDEKTAQQQRKPSFPLPPRREEPKMESSFHLNQEAARNVLKNSNDGLKKDDIDISDPFGQSYDELFTPFSGGNSQEENLEKRKLALRGLHNLINNLG